MFRDSKDLSDVLQKLPKASEAWRGMASNRQKILTKPPGSLGRLEDLAVFMAGWGHQPPPACQNMTCVVFAGNHGVTYQAISPYPASVTSEMVKNFEKGGAAINALAAAHNIRLDVKAIHLDVPTGDISMVPAMTESEVLSAMYAGSSMIVDNLDLLIVGEMGIGNSTIAAALCAATFGGMGKDWVGPGTGLDAVGVANKADVVDRALARMRQAIGIPATTIGQPAASRSALDVMAQIGGRETCAIAGAVLTARVKRIPVMLDGFITTAAVAPLFAENPDVVDHLLSGHVSAEPAHARLLARLGLTPILDLGMRLGEGTGGVLAAGVVRAAVNAHNTMATFDEAGVSTPPSATGDASA
ncbi:MAG: nicotinate-nucleotide--dimethylbenzimidazole phosphoribosyltransferase [Pseudomonadota bacterium]